MSCKLSKKLASYVRQPKQHQASLKDYVQKGGDVNMVCKGTTALCEASRSGDVDTMEYILKNGGNVNVTDERGCSATYIAASHGHLDALQCLLQAGADTEVPNRTGFTALVSSLQNRNDQCSKALIQAGASVNYHRPNTHGVRASLLYYVVFARGHVGLAEAIIRAGTYPEKITAPLSFILLEDSHMSQNLVQLFLAAGCSLRCDGWVDVMERRGDRNITDRQRAIVRLLDYANSNPSTLQALCRVAIRVILSRTGVRQHLSDRIDQLPLPQQLKNYVTLHDIFLE